MKRILFLAPAMLLLSCGGKQQAQAPETETVVVEQKVSELPLYELTDTVALGNCVYTYDIVRQASKSLPVAHDEQFGDTRDNTIALTIWADGNKLFEQTFTKTYFRSHIEEDFYPRAILDGISFREAQTGKGLTFMFSVSEPDSDMTIPFAVTISPDGQVSVEREQLDYLDQENEC